MITGRVIYPSSLPPERRVRRTNNEAHAHRPRKRRNYRVAKTFLPTSLWGVNVEIDALKVATQRGRMGAGGSEPISDYQKHENPWSRLTDFRDYHPAIAGGER